MYDEGLAERLRDLLEEKPGITEKRMFGGLAFMLNGNMCAGIVKDSLMVRVGPEAGASLLGLPHARPFDFTGKPLKGFLLVDPEGLEDDDDLAAWVRRGVAFAESLPARG